MKLRLPRVPSGIIIFLIISGFVIVGMSFTIYEWQIRAKTKPERFFELVHNFPTDYNFYLSRIRQGKEGAWLAREKYTSEDHNPSLSQVLYVLIGRVSDWAHVQTPYVWVSYHVMRIFFAFFLLFVMWKFVTSHVKDFKWQIFAFILVVTASTWPKLEWVRGLPRFGGYMPWWTQVDSLQRLTFMPHVLLGQGLMVFIFWVLSGGFIRNKHPGNYVFLGIVGLILGIIFPPALIFTYGVIAVLTIGEFVWGWLFTVGIGKPVKQFTAWVTKWFITDVSGRIMYGILSFPSILYFSLLFQYYPWKRLAEYDATHPSPFKFWEYFLALGPTLPLGILGGILLVAKLGSEGAKRYRIVFAWLGAWLGFLALFTQIPQQSPLRFGQMVPHVPLAILTWYLFDEIRKLLAKKKPFAKVSGSILLIPAFIIILGFGSMASSFMWLKDFVDHKLRADIPLVPQGAEVMYPLRDLIEATKWLEVYTPRDAIVLAGMTTSNYIPVYSGNTTFIGHANTVELENKWAAVNNFYKRHLPHDEEMAFIRSQKISYIVYGPQEMEINGWQVKDLRDLYPELGLAYENNWFKVYSVPY